ncbi:hypothetical protein SESBI_45287 [Sesbania bispinosa]|nr:hypothetical protein SESBI_45287 [Sesbania bispinosa]
MMSRRAALRRANRGCLLEAGGRSSLATTYGARTGPHRAGWWPDRLVGARIEPLYSLQAVRGGGCLVGEAVAAWLEGRRRRDAGQDEGREGLRSEGVSVLVQNLD